MDHYKNVILGESVMNTCGAHKSLNTDEANKDCCNKKNCKGYKGYKQHVIDSIYSNQFKNKCNKKYFSTKDIKHFMFWWFLDFFKKCIKIEYDQLIKMINSSEWTSELKDDIKRFNVKIGWMYPEDKKDEGISPIQLTNFNQPSNKKVCK